MLQKISIEPKNPRNFDGIVNGKLVLVCPTGNFPKKLEFLQTEHADPDEISGSGFFVVYSAFKQTIWGNRFPLTCKW